MERVTPRRKVKACIVRDYRMKLIEEAISEQKRLNIVYRSSWNNAVTRRAVTPKRVEASYDRSYLVAHCHLRDEERIFRVDCIIDVDEGK
jgi:predicted DNA-binding transcriptional regulator YafY